MKRNVIGKRIILWDGWVKHECVQWRSEEPSLIVFNVSVVVGGKFMNTFTRE